MTVEHDILMDLKQANRLRAKFRREDIPKNGRWYLLYEQGGLLGGKFYMACWKNGEFKKRKLTPRERKNLLR